jgi:magnesium chelatase subunit I
VRVPELVREVVEETAFQARRSEFVDQASGVSVRLPIALLENVVSNAERRALATGRGSATARVADLFAAQSAVAGKVELVFEGEREGAGAVAERLLGQAAAAVFQRHFPAPYAEGKREAPAGRKREERAAPEGDDRERERDVYKPVVDWFAAGNSVVVRDEGEDDGVLLAVPQLATIVRRALPKVADADLHAACELVLEGLHQASLLSKERSADGVAYGDMLKRMFAGFED